MKVKIKNENFDISKINELTYMTLGLLIAFIGFLFCFWYGVILWIGSFVNPKLSIEFSLMITLISFIIGIWTMLRACYPENYLHEYQKNEIICLLILSFISIIITFIEYYVNQDIPWFFYVYFGVIILFTIWNVYYFILQKRFNRIRKQTNFSEKEYMNFKLT
jgi:hypothetical protein